MEFRERMKEAMPLHNLVGHPLMTILILLGFDHLAGHVHKVTLPGKRTRWAGPRGVWLKTVKKTAPLEPGSWIDSVSYGYTRVRWTGWLPFGVQLDWWWELNKDLGRVKEAA